MSLGCSLASNAFSQYMLGQFISEHQFDHKENSSVGMPVMGQQML
jgi:hypothetical protein